MATPRAINSPIFGRGHIPGGRLSDVVAQLKPDEVERCAFMPHRPRGFGFTEYTLHRFPSVEALDAEIAEDDARCPAEMGGGSRRMGKARIGWSRCITYSRAMRRQMAEQVAALYCGGVRVPG